MKYNLLKKEGASSWEVAKEKFIKEISLNKERIDKDYKKAFPYDFDSEKHFVYEGELNRPYRITEDFQVIFYSDKESLEAGYITLGEGEFLKGNNIVKAPKPSQFHEWSGSEWVYIVELERSYISSEIERIEHELERVQAQIDSREKLGMYTEVLELKKESLLEAHCNCCQNLVML